MHAIESINDQFRLFTQDKTHEFSHVVCAVPPQRLARLIANLPELAESSKMVEAFDYQPIYTVYLQYPESTRLPKPMLGMVNGFAQWVFDRGQTNGTPGLLAAIISAKGNHQSLNHDELARRVHHELQTSFTSLPAPLWHKVIAEKQATFFCNVNLQRPTRITPLKHFYLAGDYTASDYPATLEAAVQSGVQCARSILENS